MSVVWALEHWEGRSGSYENVLNNRRVRTWKVKTNDKTDDDGVIVAHFADTLGIKFLTPHPNNSFFTARQFQVDQIPNTPYGWDVRVTYSTEPLREDEDEPENPLDRPVRITWSSELSQEFTTKDKDGKPMMNSAGDALEPFEKDDVRWIIRLTKNFSQVPSWVATYVNRVNSTSITIQGVILSARTAKVQSLEIGEVQVQNDIPYQEVSAELAYKLDTWDVDRLDEGFHYLDSGSRKRVLLDDNEPSTEPVPLDGSGGILSSPDEDNAVFRTFNIYSELDLNSLMQAFGA